MRPARGVFVTLRDFVARTALTLAFVGVEGCPRISVFTETLLLGNKAFS
jgi:hypothetical protein